MALIDKLTAIADAVRAKTGGSALMTLDEIAKAIGDITGGAAFPEPKLLCTLTAEMTKKEWLGANPIPLRYKHSIVFIKISGSNIATKGSYTVNWYAHFIGQTSDKGNDCELRNQQTGLVSPDAVGIFNSSYGLNESYASVVDNKLTASNTTNTSHYFAAGNSIYYLEIPFNFRTLSFDFEERVV